MSTISWEDRPPVYPNARVLKVTNGKHSVMLLGEHRGKWVHWCGPRSLPCLREQCPRSRHKHPSNWFAYYPAAVPIKDKDDPRKIVSWSTTVIACNPENARIICDEGTPRHLFLNIHKEPESKHFTIQAIKRWPTTIELPAVFSVEMVLYRLWGLQVGTENTIPKVIDAEFEAEDRWSGLNDMGPRDK